GFALAAWGWARARGAANAGATWEYIGFGDTLRLNAGATAPPALALSPDGRTLIIRGEGQNARLWLKHRGDLDPTPIIGTERSSYPTFSPDGEWVAFIADGQLKKVRVGGGATVTIADSAALGNFSGIAWLDDGTLVFVKPSLVNMGRVSANGG